MENVRHLRRFVSCKIPTSRQSNTIDNGYSNFLMIPLVYYMYPETAYRSLEEIDEIFQNSRGLRGVLDVVKVAKKLPRRYGKDGELLVIDHEVPTASGHGEAKVSAAVEQVEFSPRSLKNGA